MNQCSLTILLMLSILTSNSAGEYVTKPGIYRIIGVFPIRSKTEDRINTDAVIWSEYFKYSIDKINKDLGEDFFGYQIFDSGHNQPSPELTSIAVKILLGGSDGVLFTDTDQCQCVDQNVALYKTLGIIGPRSSSNAVFLNSLLSYENLTVVSYAATSIDLIPTESFYRTVPNDFKQATFIKDVLLEFEWTYIFTVGSDDVYGRSGIAILEDVFKSNNICLNMKLIFDVDKVHTMENTVLQINEQNSSKVVVIWALKETVEKFFDIAARYRMKDFIWIISEDSGVTDMYRDNHLSGIFLSVVLNYGKDQEFEDQLLNISYQAVHQDQTKTFLRKLFESMKVKDRNSTLKDMGLTLDLTRLGAIYESLHALTRAFNSFFLDKQIPCPQGIDPYHCITYPLINHRKFNRLYLNNVSFNNLNGENLKFKENGETNHARYELYITKRSLYKIEIDFQLTLQWSQKDNSKPDIHLESNILQKATGNMSSKCSEECRPGFYPLFDSSNTCCWFCVPCDRNNFKNKTGLEKCISCPLNSVTNIDKTKCILLTVDYLTWSEWRTILLFVTTGTTICLIAVISTVFYKYSQTPIVRSSNIILSIIQISAHLALAFTPLLFVGNIETTYRCTARVYLTGILLTIIIGISLVKVTHLLTVFNLKFKLTKGEALQQTTKEMGILILTVLVNVSIVIITISFHAVSIKTVTDRTNYTLQHRCEKLLDHYFVQICYLLILLIVCGVQSFRGRGLPGRFNEAQYTFFAMFTTVLLGSIGIPLRLSTRDQTKIDFLVAMLTLVINIVLLLFLYGYKIKLILFYPEENTTEAFQRDRLASVMNAPEVRRLSRTSTLEWRVNSSLTNHSYSSDSLKTLTGPNQSTDSLQGLKQERSCTWSVLTNIKNQSGPVTSGKVMPFNEAEEFVSENFHDSNSLTKLSAQFCDQKTSGDEMSGKDNTEFENNQETIVMEQTSSLTDKSWIAVIE
ncbi:G-protein coupled receptor family C group 6 member A-like [Clytia hemisphaerica]|uniref:G-protein coupled receptor family C group 6 member A-like n=1 Tax=Clytia hemisphaerica TaxID=252671 RepID=UPI0034D6815A